MDLLDLTPGKEKREGKGGRGQNRKRGRKVMRRGGWGGGT